MDMLLNNTASNIIPARLVEFYDYVLSKDDPRTRDWPLTSSPMTPISYMLTYFVVMWAGPRVMQNKKPMNLGSLLTVYNFALVALSAYMTYEFFMSAFLASYSLGCQHVDYTDSPLALRMARVCWVYYFSKYIEVLDTVFFIMRKKNKQISFLHVYHHGTMIMNWWACVRFIAGGPVFFHALLNSFVHVVMYSYYGLSSLGPSIQPPLWCKKVVTKIQVTQFLAVLVHSIYVTTRCDFPLVFSSWSVFYAVSMIVLFGNFYYQQFIRRSRQKLKKNGNMEPSKRSHAVSTNTNTSVRRRQMAK